MRKLSGEEVEKLAALLSGELSAFEAEVITSTTTGDKLYDSYASDQWPKGRVIYAFVLALNDNGTLEPFLVEVYRRKPHAHELREAIEQLVPRAALGGPSSTALSLQSGG